MRHERDTLVAELMRQARSAQREAKRQAARAEDAKRAAALHAARAARLAAFVRRLREAPDVLALRCAWCGRIEVAGEFVAHADFLAGGIPERLVRNATHGICPECLEREQRRADAARDR